MSKRLVWEVEWSNAGSEELAELLADGWEPFAVIAPVQPFAVVYVRRKAAV